MPPTLLPILVLSPRGPPRGPGPDAGLTAGAPARYLAPLRYSSEELVANIASAQKKNRQMIKHRAANRAAMSSLRTVVKTARAAVDNKAANAADLVKSAISKINKAVTKGLLKKNTGARYTTRLATRGRDEAAPTA